MRPNTRLSSQAVMQSWNSCKGDLKLHACGVEQAVKKLSS